MRYLAIVAILVMGIAVWISTAAQSNASQKLFRFGLTTRMFRGINENDGRAAMKVYIETVLEQRGIGLESFTAFDNIQDVGEALRNGKLDAASVTTEEYFRIQNDVRSVHLFDEPNRRDPGEEYWLLVNKDGGVTNLTSLKGGRLMEFDNLRNELARMWLDVLLMEQGLPRTEILFESVTTESKLAKVVLPVFFGTAQASLVTRRGFETMVELNPQVGKKLRVLAASPAYVPTVTCFGPNANQEDEAAIVDGIQKLHEQPRGRQLLTVFQGGERLVEFPDSYLDRVKALNSKHGELLKKAVQEEPVKRTDSNPSEDKE